MTTFDVQDQEGYDEDIAERWYNWACETAMSTARWHHLSAHEQAEFVKTTQVMRQKKNPRPIPKVSMHSQQGRAIFDMAAHYALSDEEAGRAWFIHAYNESMGSRGITDENSAAMAWGCERRHNRNQWIDSAIERRADPEVILKTQALKEKGTNMKFNTPQFVSHRSCRLTTGEMNGKNDQKEKLRS